jgi:hypothetical protein
VCNDFTASGLDGAMTLAGTSIGLTVSGSLTFQATNFNITYTGTTIFNATTTGKTITTNGVTFIRSVNFNGAGGEWKLGSAMVGDRVLVLNLGTFDLNGFTLTLPSFTSNNSPNARTIAIGTVQMLLTGSGGGIWNAANSLGLTVTGTGTINLTGSSAKTFMATSVNFSGNTINQGGAGAMTIIGGSNTFGNITNTYKSTGATSILFTAGTTNTFTDWNASGESTRLLTIGSATAASHTLSKASGTVNADFLSISRSTATGGATWNAGANSTDGGNNSGWIFGTPPATATGNFLVFF